MNPAEESALLELFSVVDAVFTEDDAFEPNKRAIGYGRLYRAWKRTRRVLAHQSYSPLPSRLPSAATGHQHPLQERQTETGDEPQVV